ncbi:hypothetical protein CYANOKiyG1_10930 [Okeania sp. KiyG1]|nr:hypothetical protein CYANOKiyG1_10930 [Okeania sp. KiyG1]
MHWRQLTYPTGLTQLKWCIRIVIANDSKAIYREFPIASFKMKQSTTKEFTHFNLEINEEGNHCQTLCFGYSDLKN